VVILTAAIDGSMIKYGARAYRYASIEVGHISQNILLIATALDVPSYPFGGFSESRASRILELRADQELVMQTIVLP
jgi:SagB-type dehydrogenase family enzyme